MKIAFVVFQLDKYSGASQQALKLARELRQHNVDIKIISLNSHNFNTEECIDDIKVTHLGGNALKRMFMFFWYLLKGNFKIVHCHGNFSVPIFISLILHKKVFLKSTLYGQDDFKTLSLRRFGKLYLKILNCIDMNNALSNQIGSVNSLFLPTEKLIQIPNGVEYPAVPTSLVEKANTFIFVGAIVERKLPHLSIQYFIDNYANIEDAKLYLIGPVEKSAVESDTDYIEHCYALAKPYSNQIQFLGNLNKTELNHYYSSAKALLFFSNKEGMPNVVLEAMAYNVVPVLSNMEGLSKELIIDKESGFIIDNPDKKIDFNDIEKAIQANTPYERIRSTFAINIVANAHLEAYQYILDK